jgi:hypothetical protein
LKIGRLKYSAVFPHTESPKVSSIEVVLYNGTSDRRVRTVAKNLENLDPPKSKD